MELRINKTIKISYLKIKRVLLWLSFLITIYLGMLLATQPSKVSDFLIQLLGVVMIIDSAFILVDIKDNYAKQKRKELKRKAKLEQQSGVTDQDI